MKNNSFDILFSLRVVICFFVISLLMLSCVLRIIVISTSGYQEIQAKQSIYKIDIARLRGTIYDCNMVPITNNEIKNYAVVLPTKNAIEKISRYADVDEITTLKKGLPIVCEVSEKIYDDDIKNIEIYKTKSDYISACHIVGYTDSTGHGISGLQLAYDDILYSEKTASATFVSDGKGRVLNGIRPHFDKDNSVISDGVVTTLDLKMQSIIENSLLNIESGCAIVAEVKTAKIRAMASVPTFNINEIYQSLNKEKSPMLNRALALYNVGSVFKPCVAVSVIENNKNNDNFDCLGSLEIEGRKFRCHKFDGHGQMNLCTALAQSCNCYFYNTAINIGGEKIYKTASALSFGEKLKIADNLFTARGVLPAVESIKNDSSIANLSIGQGKLLTSPVALLNLYLSIAGDGSYYMPSIVENTIKEGKSNIYDIGYKTRVMKEDTASKIREYLKTVLTDGTGEEAMPTLCTAAGKTATAQTGRYYDDGTEITNSWFCGFFPADEPKYVVVVMSDSKTSVSTAAVFAEIVDEITKISNIA